VRARECACKSGAGSVAREIQRGMPCRAVRDTYRALSTRQWMARYPRGAHGVGCTRLSHSQRAHTVLPAYSAVRRVLGGRHACATEPCAVVPSLRSPCASCNPACRVVAGGCGARVGNTQHAADKWNRQQTTCNMQQTTCNVHQTNATSNKQQATEHMQQTTCSR
jgi:hypothetical protein